MSEEMKQPSTDQTHDGPTKKSKKRDKKPGGCRRFFLRFLLFLLLIFIGLIVWGMVTYNGLPSGIDEEDALVIATARGSYLYTHQLPTGNKSLDKALKERRVCIDELMVAYDSLLEASISMNSHWIKLTTEATMNAQSLSRDSAESEMIFGLGGIDVANKTYLSNLTKTTQELIMPEEADPLTKSHIHYDRMMNTLLLCERHSEQMYLTLYRQSYLNEMASGQGIDLNWNATEEAMKSFTKMMDAMAHAADLQAYLDTGDYHLTSYHLAITEETMMGLDEDLTSQIQPYYDILMANHEKPMNYLTLSRQVPRPQVFSLYPGAHAYADDAKDNLTDARNTYSQTSKHKSTRKGMTEHEARMAIWDMLMPYTEFGTLYPEFAGSTDQVPPKGDLTETAEELSNLTHTNSEVANSTERLNTQEQVTNLASANQQPTTLVEKPSSSQPSIDPVLQTLLNNLKNEKFQQTLIEKVTTKQEEISKISTLLFGASNNKQGPSSILASLTQQLDKYGPQYLNREQLANAYDYINTSLANLRWDQKLSAILAFSRLDSENLLQDINKRLLALTGLEEAINTVIETLLSAFTLGFIDFDIDKKPIGPTRGTNPYDRNAYEGKPGSMNGTWSGISDIKRTILSSNVEGFNEGIWDEQKQQATGFHINKNGSNYTFSIPQSMGEATVVLDPKAVGPQIGDLNIHSIECELKGNRLVGKTTKTVTHNGETFTVEIRVDGTVDETTHNIKGSVTNMVITEGENQMKIESLMAFDVDSQSN